jgi:hypothetical protein
VAGLGNEINEIKKKKTYLRPKQCVLALFGPLTWGRCVVEGVEDDWVGLC